MTNREKFEEIFQPITDQILYGCLVCPDDICKACPDCKDCPYDDWWEHEYKEKEAKAMTRIECEQAIMEKLGEIRKIYEKFDSAKTPEGVSISLHLGYPSEEEKEEGLWRGWYGSVSCFVEDASDDIHYILNAFTSDGEMYEMDTKTLVKGVNV